MPLLPNDHNWLRPIAEGSDRWQCPRRQPVAATRREVRHGRAYLAHLPWSARGTESLQTRRWREVDSNPRSLPEGKSGKVEQNRLDECFAGDRPTYARPRLAAWFATDSPLERAGFEPSVPNDTLPCHGDFADSCLTHHCRWRRQPGIRARLWLVAAEPRVDEQS